MLRSISNMPFKYEFCCIKKFDNMKPVELHFSQENIRNELVKRQFIMEGLLSTFNYFDKNFFFSSSYEIVNLVFWSYLQHENKNNFKLTAIKTLSTEYLPQATFLSFCPNLGLEKAYI